MARMYRNGNGNHNGNGNGRSRSDDRQPTVGEQTDEYSYPCPESGEEGRYNEGNVSLGVQYNHNLANFVTDPPVFNDSPSMKKSYAWNRGEEGNANGGNGGRRGREED